MNATPSIRKISVESESLDQYLREISAFPLIDRDREAHLARRIRERSGSVWSLGETGAAGPTGNRYGDPAGHTCVAVTGPTERTATLRTGSGDRRANMHAFATRALELFAEQIGAK